MYEVTVTHFLDARNLACPLPVFKARAILKTLPAGAVLRVWCKTEAAIEDFKSFCQLAPYQLLSVTPIEDYYEIILHCP